MMDDPTRLCQLVEAAEAERNRFLDMASEREQAALGIMGEVKGGMPVPENLGFALYTILLPSMVTSSPVFNVRSNGSFEERLQGAALAAAGTQMAQKQRMHQALEPCAWDFVFKPFSAAFIEKPAAKMSDLTKEERATMKGRMASEWEEGEKPEEVKSPHATDTPMMQIPPRWPRVKRLDPRMCGFDHGGGTLAQARFTWFDTVERRDVLDKRAAEHPDDWYVDAVTALDTYGDHDRDEVCYRTVYEPGGVIEGQPPNPNQPGVIRTVGRVQQDGRNTTTLGVDVRRPFYWEGHPGGPIVFEGQYTTGCDSFFTTLLLANHDALAMLDAVSFAAHEKIRRHTVKYAYDAAYQAEAEEIQKSDDGAWVAVPGLRDGRVLERIETGELSPAEVNELREVQLNAQRALGLDDAARGLANSDATATAVSVAANTTRTKVQYVLARWERFVSECMERMAWEIAHDDRVVIRLDEKGRGDVWRTQLAPMVEMGLLTDRDVEQLVTYFKQNPMLLQGGDFANEENELDWHSLNIRIEPGSMDGSLGDQAMARESAWNQQMAFLGQMVATQPHMDWDTRIRKTAEAFGVSGGDMILDRQVLQQMIQMQLAAMPPGQPGVAGQMPDAQKQGATLREASGGAASPSGVDPGTFQMTG